MNRLVNRLGGEKEELEIELKGLMSELETAQDVLDDIEQTVQAKEKELRALDEPLELSERMVDDFRMWLNKRCSWAVNDAFECAVEGCKSIFSFPSEIVSVLEIEFNQFQVDGGGDA